MTTPDLEAQVEQMLPQVARSDYDTRTLDAGKLIGAKQYRALALPAVLRALQAERDHAEELRGVLTITREQRDGQATTIAALQAENARLTEALAECQQIAGRYGANNPEDVARKIEGAITTVIMRVPRK